MRGAPTERVKTGERRVVDCMDEYMSAERVNMRARRRVPRERHVL